MKTKHINIRKRQCDLLASASTCSRRQVGALIVCHTNNVVISEGYNGAPRGAKGALCGGRVCLRDAKSVQTGTQNDIGCHHAEANAILNAVRVGQSTMGRWLFVNHAPCLMCAKLIHHAGIVRVFCPVDDTTQESTEGGASQGIAYLTQHGVCVSDMSTL